MDPFGLKHYSQCPHEDFAVWSQNNAACMSSVWVSVWSRSVTLFEPDVGVLAGRWSFLSSGCLSAAGMHAAPGDGGRDKSSVMRRASGERHSGFCQFYYSCEDGKKIWAALSLLRGTQTCARVPLERKVDRQKWPTSSSPPRVSAYGLISQAIPTSLCVWWYSS